MKYFTIPYINKKISRVFYGTAIPPLNIGANGNDLLDAVYEMGVTAFDTARVYGGSEASLGRWIEERGMAEKIVLLSKCGHPDASWRTRVNEKEMREDFAESVKNLRTNYIDIYLLHRDDPQIPAGVAVEVFNAMHAEGKIGAFGGSNWTFRRIEEANEYAYKHSLIPFTVSSPYFGLAEPMTDLWGGGSVSISGAAKEEERKWYRENQMPLIAYSSLAHGFFSGRVKSGRREEARQILDPFAQKGYLSDANFERLRRCEELAEQKQCTVSQLAMAWMFCYGLNVAAIVSSSNQERLKSNLGFLDLALNAEEARWLNLES